MSAPNEPFAVPAELAARLRVYAAQQQISAEEALVLLLDLVLAAFEGPLRRSGRWMLGYLETDDGPPPPSGLGKVIDDHSRWSPVRLALQTDEPASAETEAPDTPVKETAPEAPDSAPRCDLCLLRRDDGATALVEVLTRSGAVVVYVERGDRRADKILPLECHEAWLDLGARVWTRVMHAADQLADRLAAPDDGEGDGSPQPEADPTT